MRCNLEEQLLLENSKCKLNGQSSLGCDYVTRVPIIRILNFTLHPKKKKGFSISHVMTRVAYWSFKYRKYIAKWN